MKCVNNFSHNFICVYNNSIYICIVNEIEKIKFIVIMEKENTFKWMVYTQLFLILYYVSKEDMYIWLSCISAFVFCIDISIDVIEAIRKHIKRK